MSWIVVAPSVASPQKKKQKCAKESHNTYQRLLHVDGRVVDLEGLKEVHGAVRVARPDDAQLREAQEEEGELGADAAELDLLRDFVAAFVFCWWGVCLRCG